MMGEEGGEGRGGMVGGERLGEDGEGRGEGKEGGEARGGGMERFGKGLGKVIGGGRGVEGRWDDGRGGGMVGRERDLALGRC